MASIPRPSSLFVVASLIVALNIFAVNSSRLARPFYRDRGGSRTRGRFGPPRFGTEGSGRRDSWPSSPPHFRAPEPETAAPRVSNDQEKWIKAWIDKHINARPTQTHAAPATVSRPPKRITHDKTIGPIKVNIIQTVDVRKEIATRYKTPVPRSRPDPDETSGNQATTLPSNHGNRKSNRRAIMADEARVPCGGPNEAGQAEECYRFNLSTDLTNDTIISGAVVLLSAGSSGSVGERLDLNTDGASLHNISIVAKFPTSGEGAFTESISAQNISFDIPSFWQSASLQRGASLITRALREGSTLFLKMSVITVNEGQPITSNYITTESSMLPILVVDIEFNGTESTTTSTTRLTHTNAVGRFRDRRALAPERTTGTMSKTIDAAPIEGNEMGNITCLGKCGNHGCCQRSITIDTTRDIGDWVIAPRTFTTNVCFGSCYDHDYSIDRDSYAELLRFVVSGSPYDDTTCKPVRTGSLSLLVFDEEYDIISVELPGWLVKECGCATSGLNRLNCHTTAKNTNGGNK